MNIQQFEDYSLTNEDVKKYIGLAKEIQLAVDTISKTSEKLNYTLAFYEVFTTTVEFELHLIAGHNQETYISYVGLKEFGDCLALLNMQHSQITN